MSFDIIGVPASSRPKSNDFVGSLLQLKQANRNFRCWRETWHFPRFPVWFDLAFDLISQTVLSQAARLGKLQKQRLALRPSRGTIKVGQDGQADNSRHQETQTAEV